MSGLSYREYVLFLSHCRRMGHDQAGWLVREQLLLFAAHLRIKPVEMRDVLVSDVRVSRRGPSYVRFGDRRARIRSVYARARVLSYRERCIRLGQKYWFERVHPNSEHLPMRKDAMSRLFKQGVVSLFGEDRWSEVSLLGCSGRWFRGREVGTAYIDDALGEMLSYVPTTGVSAGDVWDDEIGASFSSVQLQRRALELSSSSAVRMDVRRIRHGLRSLGLLPLVDSKYGEFVDYLRLACPGESAHWYKDKFYEWACTEVLGEYHASAVDGVDDGGGSESGADVVCVGEG
jgi:hypothetical protein